MYGRRMELDIEALLDAFQYSSLVDVVVTGVHDAHGLWPAFLSCADRGPEDSLATTACIAIETDS